MLPHYMILDISPDSGDEEIRKRYLELVKKHPPEKDPDKFRRITEAYEAIKDVRLRIAGQLFGGLAARDTEGALRQLAGACEIKRRRVGLKELFKLEKR